MNHFAVLLGFLAAPVDQQIQALPLLPADSGEAGFFASLERNPLVVIVEAYRQYFYWRDDEPWSYFVHRLGLSADLNSLPPSNEELSFLMHLLQPAEHSLWCRKALERKPEWRLVRRVAMAVQNDLGWHSEVSERDVSPLVAHYSPMLQRHYREYGRPW